MSSKIKRITRDTVSPRDIFRDNGNEIVDFEPGTDEDFDSHAVEVMNGYGYYDTNGRYKSYS